jgi:hypothetical protein
MLVRAVEGGARGVAKLWKVRGSGGKCVKPVRAHGH